MEGFYANGKTNRFEWKNTIGPIEERPGHMNQNWGYRVSDGFGFHEMLQLTEDLGAEPLFVVNMGMGHAWVEDYTRIDEYIQEALDAIEYCNGDAKTTKWGALRAKNGHPEPFNLCLLEIGNENYNFSSENNNDQSDHYAERYEQFRKAIKAKYPEVTLIGNVESWGTDNPSWRNPYPVDAVDEHYYRNPSWFVSQYNKYDTYSRASHKIYVGEYAVTQDYGINGHLNAALGGRFHAGDGKQLRCLHHEQLCPDIRQRKQLQLASGHDPFQQLYQLRYAFVLRAAAFPEQCRKTECEVDGRKQPTVALRGHRPEHVGHECHFRQCESHGRRRDGSLPRRFLVRKI